MIRKAILAILMCVGLTAAAQEFSDEIVVLSVDGDYITVESTATAKDKKKARELAEHSVFNALMHSGFPELKSGTPMVANKRPDYDYRLFSESRYISYISGEIKNLDAKKINNMQRAKVRFTVSLKAFKKDLERNNIALNPTWQDSKAVKATAALNPTIVVVPYVPEGGDFEIMRSKVQCSNMMRHIVNAVAAEFSKRGYKTRDFVAMLENSKTNDVLNHGTQTDARTMIVQQLPGDIVVSVDANIDCIGGGYSCDIVLKAIEKQTAGNLASATYESGRFLKADSTALANYALDKVSDAFFSGLTCAFEDMVKKGREVVIDMTLAESVSDWDFDQDAPATGNFFKDALDEWLRGKSHQGVYEMGANTDKYIHATLNLPLWDMEKNRSYSLSNFGSELRRFFKTEIGSDYKASVTAMGQKINIVIE
ncbi:MAG: hypothetical protein K2O88_03905 [Paramuribaculum sp.]|nr:hypothetical protein [Paramuribaculum sp.]